MSGWLGFASLSAAGLIAGTLNVVAGGGSFLTLPLLIFWGLPPTVANGTNRVGILLQNVGALWSFSREGVLDWRFGLRATIPAALGALLGTWGALRIGDEAFRRILALLMIAISLWTLWDPLRHRRAGATPGARRLALWAGFFVVGLYGGFVQAGVGFFVLAATTMAGLDLVQGNAIKVLSILAFTVISLTLFALNQMVHWPAGLALAAGTLIGGQIGVKLTVLKGHRWLRGVVTVTIVLLALKLLLLG
jgi:uncharacterized membrane protein YfcA